MTHLGESFSELRPDNPSTEFGRDLAVSARPRTLGLSVGKTF
ncbi:MAG: hypothetical protein ACREXP_25645 [Steroidobacteraceae bacterium]